MPRSIVRETDVRSPYISMIKCISNCVDTCRRVLLPCTSLFTFGLVSYISYVYLAVYCKILTNRWEIAGSHLVNPAHIQGGIFVIFPFLIFWALLELIFGDKGYVNKKLLSKIYKENNVIEYEIGRTYTLNDVRLLLTRNYLKS
jgi:hypothetical protein